MQLTPIMDPEALNRFLEADFPQLYTDGKVFEVVEVASGGIVMRLMPGERHLRPQADSADAAAVWFPTTGSLPVVELAETASATCSVRKEASRAATDAPSIFIDQT